MPIREAANNGHSLVRTAQAVLQVQSITLPASSRYLDSLLQLQTRIQLGLAADELLSLLEVHGLAPRLVGPIPDPESNCSLMITIEPPEFAPQLITCTTTSITLH
ncbi:hypothetical protein OU800_22065 [Pseudomonas sp. GOM7]|uniref:hypothetical protein n=1 Tax=Pseudomonas sp. GOM7 TaxID=2998079 RepID=UPI00227B0745|nr:hypothetical protein [Pseudomonas sp. GOM7]WAJ37261.1 hypothetical protein OU800_22065 [Pseudomonas sp. GOM7]